MIMNYQGRINILQQYFFCPDSRFTGIDFYMRFPDDMFFDLSKFYCRPKSFGQG